MAALRHDCLVCLRSGPGTKCLGRFQNICLSSHDKLESPPSAIGLLPDQTLRPFYTVNQRFIWLSTVW